MGVQLKREDTVTFMGVGDVGSDWYRLENPEEIIRHAAPVIRQADIAFAQQEGLWTEKDNSRQHVKTSSHLQQQDYTAILAKCGFNVVSVASNHAFMYGPNEFVTNIENHKRSGFKVIGGGKNSREAHEPAIFDCKGVRVALLGYCSVLPPISPVLDWAAGKDTCGVAPMRYRTYYEPTVPEVPDWPQVSSLAVPYPKDWATLMEDIHNTKPRCDVLIVSIHGGISNLRSVIAQSQIELFHSIIDEGADMILGHHAHILKGIEVYKGKACFYGLCNFMQVGARERVVSGDHHIARVNKVKDPGPDWPFYVYHPEARMSMVAKCLITKNGIQQVSYLPVAINGQAQPRILSRTDADFDKTVTYMSEITADYFKTSFAVEGDEVLINTQ